MQNKLSYDSFVVKNDSVVLVVSSLFVGQYIIFLCIVEDQCKPAPKDLNNSSKMTKNAQKLIGIRGFE
jgi:hypothetical protein